MLLCNIRGEIPSASAQEKKVHFFGQETSRLCGNQRWGDPRTLPGYLGKGNHPWSPLLSSRVTAG